MNNAPSCPAVYGSSLALLNAHSLDRLPLSPEVPAQGNKPAGPGAWAAQAHVLDK